ncbi:MAG: hypothetical protein J0H17_00090 [Rhizobiales bacterium]|nr:hypothetical protein [Hyphomicrobiales bacterium]
MSVEEVKPSAIQEYIANGGDEVAMLKAALEHCSGHLGEALDDLSKLRAALEAVSKAKMPGEARRIATEALRADAGPRLREGAPQCL